MKIVGFILGIVVLVLGLGFTGFTWYSAYANGRIIGGLAYTGPVLIVLGCLRVVRAAAVVPLPSLGRIAVVGVAVLVGYGDSTAIKAIFPTDQVVTTTHH
jgi:hypothetical protein